MQMTVAAMSSLPSIMYLAGLKSVHRRKDDGTAQANIPNLFKRNGDIMDSHSMHTCWWIFTEDLDCSMNRQCDSKREAVDVHQLPVQIPK